ncbi:MAG: GntR family transcriptional regulator [Bacteroidetes Order II. Incertae sedis bacterium]|nr:GntR family transcriptional regulator [Bacteroidetes Order II. bacterium]
MMNTSSSLSDQAYDAIERMIVTLELPPGNVFSEGDLSTRVGIGRTPLREALQRLAADRLVIALPRRGMMVTQINDSEYLSLLDTREVVDRLIAEQAAKRASPEEREKLRASSNRMKGAALIRDQNAFMRADRDCDDIMERACGNPYAYQAASSLHAHCRRFWSMHRHLGDLEQSADLHAAIMNSISDGDAIKAGKASDSLIAYLKSFARQALNLE